MGIAAKKKLPPELMNYPDNNSNGIPDAFEHRKPIAELLGFTDQPKRLPSQIDPLISLILSIQSKPDNSPTLYETSFTDQPKRLPSQIDPLISLILSIQSKPDNSPTLYETRLEQFTEKHKHHRVRASCADCINCYFE